MNTVADVLNFLELGAGLLEVGTGIALDPGAVLETLPIESDIAEELALELAPGSLGLLYGTNVGISSSFGDKFENLLDNPLTEGWNDGVLKLNFFFVSFEVVVVDDDPDEGAVAVAFIPATEGLEFVSTLLGVLLTGLAVVELPPLPLCRVVWLKAQPLFSNLQ